MTGITKRRMKPLLLETELPNGLYVATLSYYTGRETGYFRTSVLGGTGGVAELRATTEEQARANHATLVEEWSAVPAETIRRLVGAS